MQIHIEKNQKEIKEHGNYGFPVNVSVEKIEAYEEKVGHKAEFYIVDIGDGAHKLN